MRNLSAAPVLPQVAFASCYVYAPNGCCATSQRSRWLCALVKAGDLECLAQCAFQVCGTSRQFPSIGRFFADHPALVPVPCSRPDMSGASRFSDRLAAAMVAQGLGHFCTTRLRRARPVRKSATCRAGCRPTVVEHYDSLVVDGAGDCPRSMVLIDDVVTKGRTLLAAASRLHEACPGARIGCFALLRTLGFAGEMSRLLDPCVGEIRWRRGDAHRWP